MTDIDTDNVCSVVFAIKLSYVAIDSYNSV